MNKIQKVVNNKGDFDKFLEKIELIYYDNEYSDDTEINKKHEKIYEDLVNDKKAFELCRDAVGEGYIQDTFLDENIMGYIAKIKGEYVGFILFKKPDEDFNELYLSLVATKPKTGMPMGQILISVMEEVAKETNIHTIIADSVEGAIDFYMKNNWEVLQKDEEEEMYLIEKQIREKTEQELEQYEDNEEDYILDFGEFNNFEQYANNVMYDEYCDEEDELGDEPNYFKRVFNYIYSFF